MAVKILVADDEPYITTVLARKLENAGFDVLVASDGQEAYERGIAESPDLIITDLQMPIMNGLEVCARLAAELPVPIPTLLLTAKGFELDPDEVERLPIQQVLTKPFSPRDLVKKVKEALKVPVAM